MTDLAVTSHLSKQPQLPVHAYFDQPLFEREMELIFHTHPRYVAHANLVPQVGDYYVLPQDEGRVLVKNQSNIELLSNVCKHRQALMLKGKGHTDHIVCPLHRWTYNLQGQLVAAPHFTKTPCTQLSTTKMQQWNGLLFEIPKNQTRSVLKDLSLMNFPNELNPENYVLGHVENHRCQYNWKTFIEVYLEDYHVEPFHPGLGRFVSCTNLSWQFGETFSVQTVGLQDLQRRAGSSTYQNWHEQVTRFFGAKLPEFGAIWLTYYPTVMVEFYPGVLTVSTLHPISPQETLNTVEFYYPEEIALFEPEFMKTQQAAYMETCIEDDEIAERMDAGRQALMRRGESEVGPYQTPMEDGMKHFHEWYRKAMDFV